MNRTLICSGLMLWVASGLPAESASKSVPTRAVIDAHINPEVQVYGSYAAVKLPITKGVKLWNPTLVETAPDGTIYAANYTGEIYTLVDSDGDGLEDTAKLFANVTDDELRYPTGLAIKGKDVYVATTQQIRIYTDRDGDGKADESRAFLTDFPWTLHYYDWTFGLSFGPDGHLYAILCTDYLNGGAAPDPRGYRGAILRISPDGKNVERFAYGLRYAYGMAFNHEGDLFFSDNKGGGNPTEEFNHVQRGGFYGHNVKKYPDHSPKIDPLVRIKHGYGSGGLCANPVENDFGGAAGDMFIAMWGPDGKWDRGSIVRIKLSKQSDGSYQAVELPFVGNLAKVIDVAFGQDGSLYAARFGREQRGHTPYAVPEGDIYRIFHVPWVTPTAKQDAAQVHRVQGDVKRGEKLYSELACVTCHSLDGTTELLGPNLKGIGDMFSRSEMMKAINEPSAGIKSGHEATRLTGKDGQVFMGRMVSRDEEGVRLMQPGNQVISLALKDIAKSETLEHSMMPPGLLQKSYSWRSDKDQLSLVYGSGQADDLLAFLNVREDVAPSVYSTGLPFGRSWENGVLKGAKNLARKALLSKQGSGKSDPSAAADGNLKSNWSGRDADKVHVLTVDFPDEQAVDAISLVGLHHHRNAPRSFEILADGEVVHSVANAQYQENRLLVGFEEVSCKKLSLRISEYFGTVPTLRELGVYRLGEGVLASLKPSKLSTQMDVWSFHYGETEPKPYFHPIRHPSSEQVMTAFRPGDHVWHRGLWFCWKKINGVNYWEENKSTQQSEGTTRIVSAKAKANDDFSADLDLTLHYFPQKTKEVVLSEKRSIHVSAPDAKGDYRMDWDMRFTAEQDVTLDVTPPSHRGGPKWGGYGGLSFRASSDWKEVLYASSAGGLATESHVAPSGVSARWHSMARKNDDGIQAVTMFDHSGNPSAPVPWYVFQGSFKFLNPSPLFNGPIHLKRGEHIRLRYRVLIHAGSPDITLMKAEYNG